MGDTKYSFGIYFDWSWTCPAIGIGFNNFVDEKYLHVSLLFLEIAIGRTGR